MKEEIEYKYGLWGGNLIRYVEEGGARGQRYTGRGEWVKWFAPYGDLIGASISGSRSVLHEITTDHARLLISY